MKRVAALVFDLQPAKLAQQPELMGRGARRHVVDRLLDRRDLGYAWALVAAGVVGFARNEVAAQISTRTGKRLASPALIADGAHARTDAW